MTPLDFALLSREAYLSSPDIGDEDSASRAILRHTPAGLCVAFPGSDNIHCWLYDFDILLCDIPEFGVVHAGFFRAWKGISDKVMIAINRNPVTFVGHSLGAAMAIIAAAYAQSKGINVSSVWAFEPPRVSIGIKAEKFFSDAKIPITLYKNGSDIVPDLPIGLRHPCALTHIGQPASPFPSIKDHMIDNVINSLSELKFFSK